MENKIEYKGYVVNIEADEYAESPDAWGNEDLFLVGFHRDFTVGREGFSKEVVRAVLNREYTDDDESIATRAKDIQKKYHVFPLEAYIHSGVALYLGGEAKIDRQWDVSALGAVFVERSKENGWTTRAKAEKAARGLIEEWNMYLSGDVWCSGVYDADGEMIDGDCGGIYGYEHAVQMGKDAIDNLVKSDIEPPFLKKDARKILSDRFDEILGKFKGKSRAEIGRALQKAISNL